MAQVYIWEPNMFNMGHCAINFDDGYYISFWPASEITKNNLTSEVRSTISTFEKDKKSLQHKAPDKIIKVGPKVDLQKVREYWNKNKSKMFCHDCNDCSNMVWNALSFGGCADVSLEVALMDWKKSVEDNFFDNYSKELL